MVNTFLISSSFEETAKVLDYKRLGKQRVEAYQIFKCLTEGTTGWKNHPATLMWKGYEEALIVYIQTMITEWVNRGYKNTITVREPNNVVMPPWVSWRYLHLSHKCSLLRKNPEYYSDKFTLDSDDEKEYMNFGYVWPTHVKEVYSTLPEPSLVCDPITTIEWTEKEILSFLANKTVNPRTGRKISATSKKGIYVSLIKAAAKLRLL